VRGVFSEHRKTILSAGESAPDFDLPVLIGGVKKRFRLSEAIADKNIVLAFYPSNWESISGQQLEEYQTERSKFLAARSEVVGICVDSIMNTTQWERELGPFDFPLCSDFWPHGEVSRAYGVFHDIGPHAGTADRSVFVVDRKGAIAFSKIYGRQDLPPLSETIEALRRL
jgi:mycoredoxin-dependent peroxiredoxin